MREARKTRKTKETEVYVAINLDMEEASRVETGIPFLDHMLTLLAFHGKFTLNIEAKGDTPVDSHHTIEDIGITFGEVFKEALGEKRGVARYATVFMPMDETLSRVVLDLSNRPTLIFSWDYTRESIGGFALENVREFLKAFTDNARITLHASVLYGDNDHHKVEALFKGLGRALGEASKVTGDSLPSTKGVL
ncbi:MAG: imidazoleglycerol-phosphate dehydratase HisB [Candidatus Izemoplasmataceae bacterium]